MKKMLIIEDDQIVGSIYLRKFQAKGFQVELAGDGESGLAAALKSKPDVVILDLMLPRLSGVEVLKKLRAEPTTHDLPVVVLSNAYMSNLVQEAWKAGANYCMIKANCTPRQLVDIVNKTMGAVPAAPPAPTAIPPPATEEQTEPPVDIERLSEMAGGDEAGIRELIDLYFAQTSNQFEQLRAAVQANALQEVERIAHKASGASATCGMNAIVPALRELERQGREGRLADAATLVAHALKELERIRTYLNNQQFVRRTSTGAGST